MKREKEKESLSNITLSFISIYMRIREFWAIYSWNRNPWESCSQSDPRRKEYKTEIIPAIKALNGWWLPSLILVTMKSLLFRTHHRNNPNTFTIICMIHTHIYVYQIKKGKSSYIPYIKIQIKIIISSW